MVLRATGEEDLGVAGGSVGFIVNLPSPGILLSECGFRDDLAGMLLCVPSPQVQILALVTSFKTWLFSTY